MLNYTGRFIMFSMITKIYNEKAKGPTLMEFFTATGKLESFFFFQLEMCRCVPCHPVVHTSNISSCQIKRTFQFSCG
jgi:hypothetical protein